jgi:hypothetical protein
MYLFVPIRLTAIRETFEESGILLVKPASSETGCFSKAHTFSSTQDLGMWREKVDCVLGKGLAIYHTLN